MSSRADPAHTHSHTCSYTHTLIYAHILPPTHALNHPLTHSLQCVPAPAADRMSLSPNTFPFCQILSHLFRQCQQKSSANHDTYNNRHITNNIRSLPPVTESSQNITACPFHCRHQQSYIPQGYFMTLKNA